MRYIAPVLLIVIPFSASAFDTIRGPNNTPPSYSWPSTTKVIPSKKNFAPNESISYSITVTGDKGIGISKQPGKNGNRYEDIGGFIGIRSLTGETLQESFRITRNNSIAPITGSYSTADTRNNALFVYDFARTATVTGSYKAAKSSSREYIYAKYDGERYFTRNRDSESDTVVITRNPALPHVVAVKKNGASAKTEAHLLNGSDNYHSFLTQISTALGRTGYGGEWVFDSADYNNDGTRDLFAIDKQGGSGKVDIHVLDGATNFKTFLLHNATAQPSVGPSSGWSFNFGDYDRDGALDLYCIQKNGTGSRTVVHILSGATHYQTYLLHKITLLGATGTDDSWVFKVADYEGDGYEDIYAIKKNDSSTQIHIMDGASSFQEYSLRVNVPFGNMGSNQQWVPDIADYNADGTPDAFFINREGTGNKTAVHVLDGKSKYQSFLRQVNTILPGTGVDGSWDFVVLQ